MDIEKIFKQVLDCAFKVHTELGPGLFCCIADIKQGFLK